MNEVKNILITGASGFIGSHIRSALLTDGRYRLVTITRRQSTVRPAKNELLVPGNFYDSDLLDTIGWPVDCLIHCAAIRGESSLDEADYQKVNVQGTQTLLEFCRKRGIPYFLFISSVGVLGTIPQPRPAGSGNKANPDGRYHQSKWQAEELVRKYHSQKLKTLILRPTITYGEGDNGFILKMVSMISAGRFIYPRKKIHIHLLSVRAMAAFVVQIVAKPFFDGRAYIIADKHPLALDALVRFISQKMQPVCKPAAFRMADIVFRSAKSLLQLLGKRQLVTSLRLISEDWTYDIQDAVNIPGFKPNDTLAEMEHAINYYLNAAGISTKGKN